MSVTIYERRIAELSAARIMRLLAQEGLEVELLGPNGPHLRIAGAFDFWISTRKRYRVPNRPLPASLLNHIEDSLSYAFRRIDSDDRRSLRLEREQRA